MFARSVSFDKSPTTFKQVIARSLFASLTWRIYALGKLKLKVIAL